MKKTKETRDVVVVVFLKKEKKRFEKDFFSFLLFYWCGWKRLK